MAHAPCQLVSLCKFFALFFRWTCGAAVGCIKPAAHLCFLITPPQRYRQPFAWCNSWTFYSGEPSLHSSKFAHVHQHPRTRSQSQPAEDNGTTAKSNDGILTLGFQPRLSPHLGCVFRQGPLISTASNSSIGTSALKKKKKCSSRTSIKLFWGKQILLLFVLSELG